MYKKEHKKNLDKLSEFTKTFDDIKFLKDSSTLTSTTDKSPIPATRPIHATRPIPATRPTIGPILATRPKTAPIPATRTKRFNSDDIDEMFENMKNCTIPNENRAVPVFKPVWIENT